MSDTLEGIRLSLDIINKQEDERVIDLHKEYILIKFKELQQQLSTEIKESEEKGYYIQELKQKIEQLQLDVGRSIS